MPLSITVKVILYGDLAMRLRALATISLGFSSSFVLPPPPQWSLNCIVRPIIITEERDKRANSVFGLGHHYHNDFSNGGVRNSEREGPACCFQLYARKNSRNQNGNSRLKRPQGGGGGTPSDNQQLNRGDVLEVYQV